MPEASDAEVQPTLNSPTWAIASVRDSLVSSLKADSNGRHLRLFFYAASARGWSRLGPAIEKWLKQKEGRLCTAYIGTDHGITDPDVFDGMAASGVDCRVMVTYSGVYHPKIVWLEGVANHTLWIGSNNLTDGGLSGNIECAVMVQYTHLPGSYGKWFRSVHDGSEVANESLIGTYRSERERYAREHLKGGLFTWSQRKEPQAPPPPPPSSAITQGKSGPPVRLAPPGSLIIEIMPRETGPGGKQIQLPKQADVNSFFGVGSVPGSSQVIRLRSAATGETKSLTMTVYDNMTMRLSISELDYLDRPCVMVFSKITGGGYEFEIVQRAM